MTTPKASTLNITRSGSWIAEVFTSPPARSSAAFSSSSSTTAVSPHILPPTTADLSHHRVAHSAFSSLAQSTLMGCATLYRTCVLWPNLRPRDWPGTPGRSPENPSASTLNWDRAALERSGWVRMTRVVSCIGSLYVQWLR